MYHLANHTDQKLILIDLIDLQWAAKFRWFINAQGPYYQLPNGQHVYLRDQIGLLVWPPRVNPSDFRLTNQLEVGQSKLGQIVYKDGNLYNNQRANLAQLEFTCEQDKRLLKGFKSGYFGVTWVASRNRWLAQVYYGGSRVHSSYHLSEYQAALAYNNVAKLYGKRLNELAV